VSEPRDDEPDGEGSPDGFAPEPPTHAPPPSPFEAISPRPGRIVAGAFDLLTQASGDLRRASFYVGLFVLGLVAPLALLTWRIAVDLPTRTTLERLALANAGLEAYFNVTLLVAGLGVLVAALESRSVAISLLAGRVARSGLDVRDALRRSRRVFWRFLVAQVIASVPLLLVQGFLQDRAAELFGGESDASVLTAALVAAVLFSPLAWVQTAVVLGDLRPFGALRQSVRLFRTRPALGVVVAVFEFGAQFVTLFGLFAGLDLVARLADAAGVGAGADAIATAVTTVLVVGLVFAIGTLVFTVAAIAVAPQVLGYLALTREAPGLARTDGGRAFRWLTRPAVVGMALATLAMAAGLATLG
jgi:hypothetical protein